jgi:hypothetical protein
MLKLPRPALVDRKPQITAAPASDELKAYVQTLVKRSEKLKGDPVDPREDNMPRLPATAGKPHWICGS